MDQVAQLLRSVSAGQPTAEALLKDNRRLNEELQSLQVQLLQATSSLEATATKFNNRQDSNVRVMNAYTALKRDNMMKEVIAVYKDYLTADLTTGSKEYVAKATLLAHDVTVMHNNSLNRGVGCEVLTSEDAGPLYSTVADREWLVAQLENFIAYGSYEIWLL